MNINEENGWDTNHNPVFHDLPGNIWNRNMPDAGQVPILRLIKNILKGLFLLYIGLGVLFCLAYLWFEIL